MVVTAVSIALSVAVIYIHKHGCHSQVPRIARLIVFGALAKVLCMRSIVPDRTQEAMKVAGLYTTKCDEKPEGNGVKPVSAKVSLKDGAAPAWTGEISKCMRILTIQMEEKEKDDFVAQEWKILSRILDRLFFWITLFLFTAGAVGMFVLGLMVN